MAEKSVDMLVSTELKNVGYTDSDINYGYSIPSTGNNDFTPIENQQYESKSLQNTRSEFEFLIFAGSKKYKNEHLILIEDKKDESKLGNITNINDVKNLQVLAVTDGFHYAYDLLSKTDAIKTIFAIAVAGKNLKSSAIFLYKKSAILDKYARYPVIKFNDNISYIFIEQWNDWQQLAKDKFTNYINENILGLNSPENEINLAHIRSVANKLSNTIDKKLKLDPFNRLLLVAGMLLGINEDANLITSFKKSYGASDLYNRIDGALPIDKFDSEKKKQLLHSFAFIKNDTRINTELVNEKTQKSEGYPLDLICKELIKKSPVGYSILDLMKQSGHIDLLGNLFDIFTKYMNVGGSSGDIVLTPSHITKFMAEIIDVNPDDNVVDITVGTGGFLISAMTVMEEKLDKNQSLTVKQKADKKRKIRENQLWGVEHQNYMYATAVTNMLLHGDGKSHIFHGDSLRKHDFTSKKSFDEIFADVEFSKLLFNPPYNNQDIFVKNGLDLLEKGGKAAIIVPKQTFNKGGTVVEDIFKNHRLDAVFDLPTGQFKKKNGTVGTEVAIFIFTAHIPHDFNNNFVTFVKLLKDEVGTKGNLKGVASEKTKILFEKMVNFTKGNYVDTDLLSNRTYFAETLKKKLEKGKYMYRDYETKLDSTPTEDDFIDTIGDYLEFLVAEQQRKNIEVQDDTI